MYAWERRNRKPTWTKSDLPTIVLIGIVGVTLNQFLFIVGLSRTSMAHSAIFANLSPILVLLMASMLGMEKLTLRKMLGVIVSLGGIVILRTLDVEPQGHATFLGDLLVSWARSAFLSSPCWASRPPSATGRSR